jgi:hypothetical protein
MELRIYSADGNSCSSKTLVTSCQTVRHLVTNSNLAQWSLCRAGSQSTHGCASVVAVIVTTAIELRPLSQNRSQTASGTERVPIKPFLMPLCGD